MGVHLSEDMTDLIEEQTSDFSSLSGDVNAVEALQETMLEPLCQYGRQVDCSGAFVMLNTSLNDNGLSAVCTSSGATLPAWPVTFCSIVVWLTSGGGIM